MSCWHGCGQQHGWPPARGWYGPADRPMGWGDDRRARPRDRELTATSLESRLDDLQEELRRVEAALLALRQPDDERNQP